MENEDPIACQEKLSFQNIETSSWTYKLFQVCVVKEKVKLLSANGIGQIYILKKLTLFKPQHYVIVDFETHLLSNQRLLENR